MYSKMNNAIYFSKYIQNSKILNIFSNIQKKIQSNNDREICKFCKKKFLVSSNNKHLCDSCYIIYNFKKYKSIN